MQRAAALAFLLMGAAPAAPTGARTVVAALTGAEEIAPGVRLADRYGDANRRAARAYLAMLLSEVGVEPQEQAYRAEGKNVYGVLAATSAARETIVLGAHFDSVRGGPGANDNATGVAVVHLVATAMTKLPCRTRDLMIAYFDEEERGLVGSGKLARWLKDASGRTVHSVHTVDQLGWDRDGDRAVELEQAPAALKRYYQAAAAEAGVLLEPTSTGSTNHEAFRNLGFQAVGLTEEYVNGDTTPHYHQPSDKLDTVNFDYLEHSAAFLQKVMTALLTEGCA